MPAATIMLMTPSKRQVYRRAPYCNFIFLHFAVVILCFFGIVQNLTRYYVGPTSTDVLDWYLVNPATQQYYIKSERSPRHSADCFPSENGTCFPSFSIAGMPKSGTSALYFYLKHHPQLVLQKKELCALALPWAPLRTVSTRYFQELPRSQDVCTKCIVGEACIDMGLMDTHAYRHFLPSISTVFILLRNPIDRMYAAYWFWCTPEEEEMNIPQCSPGSPKWNPRKNVSYFQKGHERWYNFPRSVEDFHERLKQRLLNSSKSITSHDFIFRDYITYMRRLNAAFAGGVHIIPTERLYTETEQVLQDITDILGVYHHNYSHISRFSVNVNGSPGMEALQEKKRGDYPPLTPEIRQEAKQSVLSVADLLRDEFGYSIHSWWEFPGQGALK